MKLTLRRIAFKSTYTIGHLYVNDSTKALCDTIEDKNRDLNKNGKFDNGEHKVASQTCIPFGTYEVTLKVKSPKFSQKAYYKNYCGGYMPRLLNVPSFDGILIHRGVDEDSSAGCIIVGYNTIVGKVTNSQKAFETLYPLLKKASQAGEKITITIV